MTMNLQLDFFDSTDVGSSCLCPQYSCSLARTPCTSLDFSALAPFSLAVALALASTSIAAVVEGSCYSNK